MKSSHSPQAHFPLSIPHTSLPIFKSLLYNHMKRDQLLCVQMNAFIWVTLPVCYFHFRLFLSWIGSGEGQMFLFGYFIPANSHTFGASLTPAGWKLRSHAGPISHAWLKNVSCCCPAWHNFQKYVNSDPCKERKPCVKWINGNTFPAISDFWSEKH